MSRLTRDETAKPVLSGASGDREMHFTLPLPDHEKGWHYIDAQPTA